MNEERKLSEQISNFLKLLEQVEKDYTWAIQEEVQAENLTQDYLHQLELLPFTNGWRKTPIFRYGDISQHSFRCFS